MKFSTLMNPVVALILLAAWPSSRAQSPPQAADRAAQNEVGKQAFLSHCGSCHDADAAKKLPDGTTLLSRLAANKDPKARLATRTKKLTEPEARGIDVYMENLIAAFKSGQRSPTDH